MYACTKFQSIWRTLVFENKFAQGKRYYNMAGFRWFLGGFNCFQVVSGRPRFSKYE